MKKIIIVAAVAAILFSLTASLSLAAQAGDPVEGFWVSIDEKTDSPTAYWKIVVQEGELTGTIVQREAGEDPEALCTECSGDYKNMPIVGTTWLHLTKRNADGSWEEGTIIAPRTGRQARAKLWIENDNLKMRASIGFISRTQTWQRVDDPR